MSGNEETFGFSSGEEIVPIKVYYIFGYIVRDYTIHHLIAAFRLTQEDSRTTVKNVAKTSDLYAALIMNGIIREKWENEFVAGTHFDQFVREIEAL